MPLNSMTGFAREDGQHEQTGWVWELRSVNGKGLDIRMRVPSGFEAIEVTSRVLISKTFKRGNIQINLQVTQSGATIVPSVNRKALDAVLDAAETLRERVGGELPSVGELLALKGVLEFEDPTLDDNSRKTQFEAVIQGLQKAVDALAAMRASEGEAVAKLLLDQVDKIENLLRAIEQNDARKPEAINKQLQLQIARLMETSDKFDSEKLHQEAVLLAAKADLQEELDRLSVHVVAARDLLNGEGPAGRKLDFLAQEFNRECNTICSKSNSVEVTSLGLDMKLVIDQFREQLQNLE